MSPFFVAALLMISQPPGQQKLADVLPRLKDDDAKVRLQAVAALATWKTDLEPRALAALARVMDDSDPRIRKLAVQTLGEAGPRSREWSGGPKFSAQLAKLFQDKDAATKKAAVVAYGQVGIDSAEELQPLYDVQKNAAIDLRVEAVKAMAQYAHDEVPAEVRKNVIDHVADSLADKDKRVQELTCGILLKIGADAVPALTRTLDSGTGTSRLWAAVALGEIGAPAREAIPSLQKALGEVPKDGRPYVQKALKQLGG